MMRSNRPLGGLSFGGMGMTPGVKSLLIINVAVFVLQSMVRIGSGNAPGALTEFFGFVPGRAIWGLEVWRFVTYMFLHGDLGHILFNMLGLWMFGSQIEARWGRTPFLIYYLVCGLSGAVTYGLFNLFGHSSMDYMIGASGAIYGILLAYGLMFPDAVILIALILPMKAKYAVMLFGLIELLSTASGSGGGVAHLAHLGGMAGGFIFLRLTIPSFGGTGSLGRSWRRLRSRPRLRVVPPESDRKRTTPSPGKGSATGANGRTPDFKLHDAQPRSEKPHEDVQPADGAAPSGDRVQIDAILDKISYQGLQSLTPEEQEILRRAGRR